MWEMVQFCDSSSAFYVAESIGFESFLSTELLISPIEIRISQFSEIWESGLADFDLMEGESINFSFLILIGLDIVALLQIQLATAVSS